MEPSCLGFLRCLLCCQDEFDDTVHVDFRAIKNAYKSSSLSDSEPEDRSSLLRHSPIPTSVPRHNEATRDLDSETSAALAQRSRALARAMWLSSPSSSSSSSEPSSVIPKPPMVYSPSPIAPRIASSSSTIVLKPAIVRSSSQIAPQPATASSSSAIDPKPAIVSSSSAIVPKPAIVSSSSSLAPKTAIVYSPLPIAPKPAFVSSSSPMGPKLAIVSSSSPVATKPGNASYWSQIALKPAIVNSPSTIAPKPAIVNAPSPIASKPGVGSYWVPISQKPAITSSSSSRVSKAQPEASSREEAPVKHAKVDKNGVPLYLVPDHIKDLIKSDVVPGVLMSPVIAKPTIERSSSTIVLKPAIVRSSSQIAPQPATASSSSAIVPKPAIVSSSSSLAPKTAIVYSPLPIAPKPAFVSSQEKGPVQSVKHTKVDKSRVPLYLVPDHIKELIKRDVVPIVLMSPVCPASYKEYFSTLLYAEDYYCEKWADYKLKDVTLELHDAARYKKSGRRNGVFKNEDQIFVAFMIDSIPEKRPYLLSRDIVFAQPCGSEIEPFMGIIKRVVKSNVILVEFKDDFHSQHYPSRRYDVSFSFNRVCLKRAHEALNSISDTLYKNFLFPDSVPSTETSFASVHGILSVKGPQAYLISGPKCASERKSGAYQSELSRTGLLVREAVFEIYRADPGRCRVLICSPSNSSCDVLMRGLKKRVPASEMFRANAAFRDKEDVPEDILSSSLYRDRDECFACPQAEELRSYKIVFSTFVSTYRLHREGLPVGHFSHIFMVDSSTSIEPEALVPLANFADENTVVVVIGHPPLSPNWVRSSIAKENGLRVSYFKRLRNCCA